MSLSRLEEKIIDMEVAAKTPSPTVEPSIRTILIGHSMGGIVAAETVIGLSSDKPIYSEDGINKDETKSAFNALMFPYVQGVLAFDTPFLGISPGVVAHGAEGHYNTAASAMSQLSALGTTLWGANSAASSSEAASKSAKPKPAALPAPPPTTNNKAKQEQPQEESSWAKWGRMAMYAGAAGAVAAGGAAAWMNRETISSGWSWASSHLEFIGCLARAEELKKRVGYMGRLREELGIGFANFYTRLGIAASSKQVGGGLGVAETVLGKDRTFCVVPKKNAGGGEWRQVINDQAKDEVTAHIGMFEEKGNPAYERLLVDAAGMIERWLRNEWYQTSSPPRKRISQSGGGHAQQAAGRGP